MATPKAQLVFPPQVHKWTVEEYYKMGAAGLFDGRRVELIEGEIFDMATMLSPHATSVTLAYEVMTEIFGKGWVVRIQLPLTLSEVSEPEPDVVVVAGKARDFKDAHPSSAALLIEVADSSLAHDQGIKAGLYAKAKLQDYWIINLQERQVEVYRRPIPNANSESGFGYADKMIFTEQDSIAPLAKPKAKIAVVDLLP